MGILAEGIQRAVIALNPFLTPDGHLFVCVPSGEPASQGGNDVERPVVTEEARAYVAALLNDAGIALPSQHQAKSFRQLLHGKAIRKPRRCPADMGQLLELVPLAQALKELAETGGTTASAGDLLRQLNAIARQLDIDTDTNWPATEDALGRQLVGLVLVMAAVGVKLTRHSNSRPRQWTVEPTELNTATETAPRIAFGRSEELPDSSDTSDTTDTWVPTEEQDGRTNPFQPPENSA